MCINIFSFFLFRKILTITAERLSDKSRMTFTLASDKTIEDLRALLNHHLPPLSPHKFDLYSYQRGALIHFHPSPFKLDYFPVIFDQSVLLLKMDDRLPTGASPKDSVRTPDKSMGNSKFLRWNALLSSKTAATRRKSLEAQSTLPNVSCMSILKQIFHPSSSNNVQADVLTY